MMGSSPNRPMSDDRGGLQNDSPANPYHVLKIRRDATATEIRLSYKRLALWHHPGRIIQQAVDITRQERRRRFQFFNLLAACYETLISADSRRRYDNLCRELEQAKLQAGVRGAMFVGGKPLPLIGSSSYDMSYNSREFASKVPIISHPSSSLLSKEHRAKLRTQEALPPLSRSSSGSSTAFSDACQSGELDEKHSCCSPSSVSTTNSPCRKTGISRIVTAATIATNRSSALASKRSLVEASSSEEEEEAEAHFTESTTRRLFGGPLSHLFKARNFEPFSDPYDIFEQVFGSQPFQRVSREEMRYKGDDEDHQKHWRKSNQETLAAFMSGGDTRRSSPAAWKGDSQVSSDGKTTIFTTSRVLHNRILTRTETITRVSPTKTKTYVTVTATPVTATTSGTSADPEDMAPPPGNLCMLLCDHPLAPSSSSSRDAVEHGKRQMVEKSSTQGRTAAADADAHCVDFCEFYQIVVHDLEMKTGVFFTEWNNRVWFCF